MFTSYASKDDIGIAHPTLIITKNRQQYGNKVETPSSFRIPALSNIRYQVHWYSRI